MPPRHRSRRRRKGISRKVLFWIGGGVTLAILLPVVIVFTLIAMIDTEAYKKQLEGSLRQVLGRDLRIRGPLTVSASLSPTLDAEDVTLANMQTGSRADMVRVERMTVELATQALLTGRLEVSRIALQKVDILIESDAQGVWNWQNTGAGPGSQAQDGPRLALKGVHLRDGRVTWRDGQSGQSVAFDVRRLSATAATSDGPVAISSEVNFGRQRIAVQGQTAALSKLADASARTPWGFFVNFENSGAKLTLTGALTRPNEIRGYSLRVDAAIQQLAALSWLTDWRLVPLHNVTFSMRLLDTGGDLPDISAVSLQAGFSNLDKLAPGFTIETARIDMPRLSDPIAIDAEGTYASSPLRVSGTLGPPALLMPLAPPGQAYNVDARADVAGATFAIRGTIAEPSKGTGMEISLGARVPDLAALGPLVGSPLPALRGITFSGLLTEGLGGFRSEVVLKNLIVALPQGDITGEAGLDYSQRPRLRAALKSTTLDVDAIEAAIAAAPTGGTGANARRVDATTPVPLPQRGRTLIPNQPLPFGLMMLGDADMSLAIEQLQLGGLPYHDVRAAMVLSDGKLVLSPLTADVAGGAVDLRVTIDARAATPQVTAKLKGQGMDLRPILAAWVVPELVSGKGEFDADLTAAGSSWHELATTSRGKVTATVTDGEFEIRHGGALAVDFVRALRVAIDKLELPRMALRCATARLDVAGGIATLDPAGLDAARILILAAGKVDLGKETATVQLRPVVRVGAAPSVVPMRIEGGWSDLHIVPDSGTLLRGSAGGAGACGTANAAAAPALPTVRKTN